MVHSKKNQADFNLILQSVLHRRWIFISCIVGFIIPVIMYNQITNPVYEATTSIIYELYSGEINKDSPQRPIDSNIKNNVMEEIKSQSLAEEVVEALPDNILKSYPVPNTKPADFNLKSHLRKLIKKDISAENIVGSDVIVIKTKGNSPAKAKVLAEMVTETLKKRHLDVRQETISSARKLIESQLPLYEQRLSEAEEALRQYKEQGGITYIDQESIEILKRITEAEVLYNKARADRDASDKRLKYLEKKLSQEREDLLPLVTANTSPMVNRLKDELIELELQYLRLKVQNYDENHPKMLEFKSQIEQTKQKLSNETLKISQGENIIDPLSQLQKIMEEIVNMEVELQTYRAQENALQQIIREYENDLKSVPEKELTLTRLIRERDVNEKIYTMLVEEREEARIREAEQFGNIRTLDPPQLPESPVRPRKLLNLVVALFLGLVMGLGLIAIFENLDTRLNTADEIKKVSDLSIISSIPKFSQTEKKLISYYVPDSDEVEAFRTLRTNLQFLGLGKTKKTILVASCNAGEGKSLITANLGISAAQLGLRTLIIDTDFRKPHLHELFGKQKEPGLSNMIQARQGMLMTTQHNGGIMVDDADDFSYDQTLNYQTEVDGLYLLPSGDISPNAPDVLALPTLQPILNSFKEQYDVVLLDSPPVNVVTDASLLSSMVDGILLVIKTGVNNKLSVSKGIEALQRTHAEILGIVINFVEKEFRYYSNNGHL